jgi:hypothetical protein
MLSDKAVMILDVLYEAYKRGFKHLTNEYIREHVNYKVKRLALSYSLEFLVEKQILEHTNPKERGSSSSYAEFSLTKPGVELCQHYFDKPEKTL